MLFLTRERLHRRGPIQPGDKVALSPNLSQPLQDVASVVNGALTVRASDAHQGSKATSVDTDEATVTSINVGSQIWSAIDNNKNLQPEAPYIAASTQPR